MKPPWITSLANRQLGRCFCRGNNCGDISTWDEHFDEFKERIDVVDDMAEDSLTYKPYDIFKYNQDKSGSLKEDDYITILHPLVVGMVNKVTKDSPPLLSILNNAALIFPNLQSIYLTVKVKDILFEGIEIDCRRNATEGKTFTVKRGISNSKDLGRLLAFDGKKELTLWGTKVCNSFKGTDGWIFAPFLNEDEDIWTYSADLCRNIRATFVKKTVFKGVDVFRYEADIGDMEHNEDEKCYCETPKTCLKKGVFDLTKCMGVPIYATLPHFLRTDETYLQQVQGLKPEPENHILTATPIEARKRMQFNLPISPNSKIDLMKSIPDALHPIFWVEE
ncbi:hypothetical protein NQ317_014679, partial [Molorchus minor]